MKKLRKLSKVKIKLKYDYKYDFCSFCKETFINDVISFNNRCPNGCGHPLEHRNYISKDSK